MGLDVTFKLLKGGFLLFNHGTDARVVTGIAFLPASEGNTEVWVRLRKSVTHTWPWLQVSHTHMAMVTSRGNF